jgi:hypothetical protein
MIMRGEEANKEGGKKGSRGYEISTCFNVQLVDKKNTGPNTTAVTTVEKVILCSA